MNNGLRIAAAASMLLSGFTAGVQADVSMKGDLRYRHESIDREGASDTRERQRVRYRVALAGEVNETVQVKARLASGGSDPVSSNQSLDDFFSSKGINLDRAYVVWSPEECNSEVMLGKMANPLIAVNDLLWDGDLNPEGIAMSYGSDSEAAAQFLVNLGYFWVEERSSADDTMLYAAQAAVNMDLGGAELLVGAGYYTFDNLQGFDAFDGDGFGNSVNQAAAVDDELEGTAADGSAVTITVDGDEPDPTYAIDYTEMEAFIELSFKAGDLPVKVFGDYVVNDDASDNDTGYLAGFSLGKAKDPGSLAIGYDYRELEADAAFGAFADSDSFGGGTDGRGHRFKVKYQLAENLQAGATYFMQETGISGTTADYDRLQLDLVAKF